ncbi:MAG: DUF4332 domain-containing protein [Methanosarcinaceae archaeon]|nr:DUF4332 domain-containing protein [Methanosarcinaceae archaeon]
MMVIDDLKQNLESLRISREIDETSLEDIRTSIDKVEIELQNRDSQILALNETIMTARTENSVLQQENQVTKKQVARLLDENEELKRSIAVLGEERPSIAPENLTMSFTDSFDRMVQKFNVPESRTSYRIDTMNVKLKTNLTLKDEKLQFQLPKPDDIISPENLSIIEFTIKAGSKEPDFSSYQEVPDLTGMLRVDAENLIVLKGFKVGIVKEKDSSAPQTTVIGQIPSANSVAQPGDMIDLEISRIIYVKMPNLVGLDIESAKEILTNTRLDVGTIAEQSSISEAGTVLSQSIEAGVQIVVGSAVDMMVAVKETVEMPNLIGKKLDSATQQIRSAKLKIESIVKETSSEKPDTVLKQYPEPGTLLMEGDSVDLVVAAVETLNVPDVVNMNINEARTVLGKTGLMIGRITKRASKLEAGAVIEQRPVAGSDCEAGTSVELVVAYNDIEIIEGIGPEKGTKLRDIGISTVSDLAASDTDSVAELVGRTSAEKFISMAKLIDSTSQLGSLGIDKQAAELLVKAGEIDSIERLREADPEKLYDLCNQAIKTGKIEVPKDYTFEREDVKRWVELAQ